MKILYSLFFLVVAVISVFTGEIVTFVMLSIILISLVNINTNLKTVINKLDKFKEKDIDEDIS